MRAKILLITVTAALCAAAPSTAVAQDAGDFQIHWGSFTAKANDNGKFEKRNRAAARALKRSGAMQAVVEEVNGRWALPTDVPILFSDLFEDGPAYIHEAEFDDGSKLTFINFPGGFMTEQVKLLGPYVRGVKDLTATEAMVAANEFVLAHEIGHAMVRQLDIPVTGREEDAVDGFAAFLLAENPRFGPGTAFAAALLFDAYASQRGRDLQYEDFADEHSVSEQRVYNFLCWLYGSDPKTFRPLVRQGVLPQARAVRCGNEWEQIERSWTRLLEPYAL